MAVEDMDPNQRRLTPAWRKGWNDANEGRDYKPGEMDGFLYTDGYRACQIANELEPANLVPVWRSNDWKNGHAKALRKEQIDPDFGYSKDFRDGFSEGLNMLFLSGQIKKQEAEWLENRLEPAVPAQPTFDPVKIPGHYNSGTIEVTNFIADQQLDFTRGNVVKYVARAGKKDPATEIQDLEKAAAYLQMAHNLANGKPAVVRDPVTKEVVWSLFKN